MSCTGVCRICLASGVRIFSIAGTPLQKVYEKFTNCSLHNEQRPMSACYICYAQLKKSHKLMLTSISTEMALTELLMTHSELTPNSVAKIDRSARDLSSSLCVSPIHLMDNISNFEVMVKSEPEDQKKQDPKDSNRSQTPDNFEAFPMDCLSQVQVEVKIEPNNTSVPGDYPADEDDQTENLSGHGSKHHCHHCGCGSTDKPSQNRHAKLNNDKPFQCNICQRRFNDKGNMTKHMRTHNGDKPHGCHICQRFFRASGTLKVHLRTHTGERPFGCGDCQMRFITKSSLDRHLKVHAGETPYECSICFKRFNKPFNLKKHMTTHTDGPLECPICSVRFTDESALDRHFRVHTGEKQFERSYCQRRFGEKNNLKSHERTHTGEKIYKCLSCDWAFNSPSTLKIHIRTHTGEKPYSCFVCSERFIKKNDMVQHCKTHTGEKPYY